MTESIAPATCFRSPVVLATDSRSPGEKEGGEK